MLIQDMNHIEVAQTEIVGGNGAAKRLGFDINNSFTANVRGNVKFNADIATAGAAADAVGGPGYLAFTKSDTATFVAPGVSSSLSGSASALLPKH
jgi:ABC-type lipopolysaccharide export system ATPase subunit